MRQRYRFLRFWADLAVTLGALVIVLGLFGAVLGGVLVWNMERPPFGLGRASSLAGAAGLAVLGLLLGGPLVATGQCLLVFLDQRALLSRILRQLRRKPGDA